jgi:hypothetical protein
MLQESSLLPISDSIKRAMKLTSKALKEIGYNVVPYFLTDDVWE